MTDTDTGNDSFDLSGFFPGMIGVNGDKGILQCLKIQREELIK